MRPDGTEHNLLIFCTVTYGLKGKGVLSHSLSLMGKDCFFVKFVSSFINKVLWFERLVMQFGKNCGVSCHTQTYV